MLKISLVLFVVAVSAGLLWQASSLGAGEPAVHPNLDNESVKDALKSLEANRDDSSMDAVDARISKAVDFLGEKHFATRMLLIAQEESRSDVEQLLKAVDRVIESLTFRPWIEAELPEGFPRFTPVHHIEVKTLPEYRMARALMPDKQRKGDNGAFWKLFSHIKRNDIAMTAPVQMDYSGSNDSREVASMAFLYGSRKIGTAGQDSADDSVEVVDHPKQDVVSIGIRGRMNPESIRRGHRALESWLERHESDFRECGPLRRMGYNSPFIPAERAFFELQIPVERIERQASIKVVAEVVN
jgi:hypothetical protein